MLSERVNNDLTVYNNMIDEWANGLLSLKIAPEECNTKHAALGAWYDLVDEAEAAELALTLKT